MEENNMSFRVNNNISAMNALRNVNMTDNAFSKSVNKLSTGLRINNASDDPAGLIVSEGFRAQIQSMGQALSNNQSALNYAKTAEGALDEVNKLLRDARSLAVSAGNTGTLDAAQIQANQSQLSSIISSITRISANTEYGLKNLLDGSAGVVGAVSNGANVSSISLSGQFNSAALTTNATVTVQVTTAATQASTASKAFAFGTTTMTAGSFTINGTTFTTSTSDTVNGVLQRINDASSTTGVRATYTTGGAITLTQVSYGATPRIDLSDASAVLLAAAGNASAVGVDAVASVIVDTNGSTAGGLTTVTFTGGRYGSSALTLSDNDGNAITLTTAGNAVSTYQAGSVTVGSSQFQIGANANQTTTLSLGNFAASQLGQGVVSGLNLSNLDITSASGATDALKVIDQAISDVTKSRGGIGNFMRNVLESNMRSLGVAKENLAASESMIRDVDIADEMTNYTKLQILNQAGLSVLAQANSAPQSVLSLLR
jgi:flagellin